jgi:hypothetical protein
MSRDRKRTFSIAIFGVRTLCELCAIVFHNLVISTRKKHLNRLHNFPQFIVIDPSRKSEYINSVKDKSRYSQGFATHSFMRTKIMSNRFFQKSALIACAAAIPVSAFGVASAKAFSIPDSAPKNVCQTVVYGVKVCADREGQGYKVYSKLGPITTQKQYIGLDGVSVTFGTVDLAGTRAQAQGGLKMNPLRIEGKVDASMKISKFINRSTSKSFTLRLY